MTVFPNPGPLPKGEGDQGVRFATFMVTMRRHFWLVLRLLLTSAALIWIFRDGALREQLAAQPLPEHKGMLAVAVLVAGLAEVAALVRFWCCLRLAGVPLTLRRTAALHFSGLFTSLFLPGMAGGDTLKVAFLAMTFPQRRFYGLFAVLMDRLTGFIVVTIWMLLVAWQRADWFARSPVAATALQTALWVAVPPAAGLLVWYLASRTHWMRTRIRRFPFRQRILQCEACFDTFSADRVRMFTIFVASVASFTAYFTIFHLAALAYEAPVAWGDTLSVMPLIDLITTLPVTFAGLGLREQIFQSIVAPLCGFPPAQGVIVSLTGFVISNTWALLGAPLFAGLQANPRQASVGA